MPSSADSFMAFSQLQRVPECPHELSTYRDGDTVEVLLPRVGHRTGVPELHDCQRLVRPGQGEYGPLVAVYATQDERVFRPQHALAVAYVLNWDAETYGPLGIEQGWSCLYVGHGLSKAWIIPVSTPASCNPYRAFESLPPTNLDIRKTQDGDTERVARWEWDSQNWRQVIGVDCGRKWCEIGEKNFRSQNHAAVPASVIGGSGHKVYKMKGWGDEQNLAIENAAGDLVPSNVWARIFPNPDVLTNTVGAQYVHVATIIVSAYNQVYWDKFRFHPLTPTNLYLRRSTRCSTGWQSEFVGHGNARIEHCVQNYPHPGTTIPGSARWRWWPTDETAWVPCVNGCCQPEVGLL